MAALYVPTWSVKRIVSQIIQIGRTSRRIFRDDDGRFASVPGSGVSLGPARAGSARARRAAGAARRGGGGRPLTDVQMGILRRIGGADGPANVDSINGNTLRGLERRGLIRLEDGPRVNGRPGPVGRVAVLTDEGRALLTADGGGNRSQPPRPLTTPQLGILRELADADGGSLPAAGLNTSTVRTLESLGLVRVETRDGRRLAIITDEGRARIDEFGPGGPRHINVRDVAEGLGSEDEFRHGDGSYLDDAQRMLNAGQPPSQVAKTLESYARALEDSTAIRYGGWQVPGIDSESRREFREEQQRLWDAGMAKVALVRELADRIRKARRPGGGRATSRRDTASDRETPLRESVLGGPMDEHEQLLHRLTAADVKRVAEEMNVPKPAGSRWPTSKEARIRYLLQSIDDARRRNPRSTFSRRDIPRIVERLGIKPGSDRGSGGQPAERQPENRTMTEVMRKLITEMHARSDNAAAAVFARSFSLELRDLQDGQRDLPEVLYLLRQARERQTGDLRNILQEAIDGLEAVASSPAQAERESIRNGISDRLGGLELPHSARITWVLRKWERGGMDSTEAIRMLRSFSDSVRRTRGGDARAVAAANLADEVAQRLEPATPRLTPEETMRALRHVTREQFDGMAPELQSAILNDLRRIAASGDTVRVTRRDRNLRATVRGVETAPWVQQARLKLIELSGPKPEDRREPDLPALGEVPEQLRESRAYREFPKVRNLYDAAAAAGWRFRPGEGSNQTLRLEGPNGEWFDIFINQRNGAWSSERAGRRVTIRDTLATIRTTRADGTRGTATGSPVAVLDRPDTEARRLMDQAIRNGGFTYSTATRSQPSSGYALSPYPDRSVVIEIENFSPAAIREFEARNADLLSQPGHHIGAWRERDDERGIDRIWLDVSIVAEDRDEAERIGREFDQRAMFHLDSGQEIQLGGNGRHNR